MASSTSQPDEEWMSDYERLVRKVNTRCVFHNGLPLLQLSSFDKETSGNR